MSIALIGGTGFGQDLLSDVTEESIFTPYGGVTLYRARLLGNTIYFLPRHGRAHSVPPHRINYRANIWALRHCGVRQAIATAAVGGLDPSLSMGQVVLADQILDFTSGRPSTFFDHPGSVLHMDFTRPYCERLRRILLVSAKEANLNPRDGGTYVAVNGPRYETAAEVCAYARLGGHIVGMTGAPEAALAREAGICYSAICMVTNLAAGLSPVPLNHKDVESAMETVRKHLRVIMEKTLPQLGKVEDCACKANWGIFGKFMGERGER